MNVHKNEYRILQALMMTLGIIAVSVGTMDFFLGVQFIHLTERGFNFLTSQSIPLEPHDIIPTTDNEFRFYATFFFGYGLLVMWVARNILTQNHLVPILASMFFVGGIGRILSHVFVGTPHPAMVALMIAELLVPIVLVFLYMRIPKR